MHNDSSMHNKMPTIHITDVHGDKGYISCMFILKGGKNLLFYVGELWEGSPIHDGEVVNYKYLQMFIQVPRKVDCWKKREGNTRMQLPPGSISVRLILTLLSWMTAEPHMDPRMMILDEKASCTINLINYHSSIMYH